MHALYRMYDADGALLYVGIAVSPLRRFSHHERRAPWWASVAQITLEHFGSQREAEAAERDAIASELPAHNIVHHPDAAARRGERHQPSWSSPTLRLRAERGLTQIELARRSGVSKATISRLELGDTDIGTRAVAPLAGFFGVTVGQLLGTEPVTTAVSWSDEARPLDRKRLVYARWNKGLSQRAAGDTSGVSFGTIQAAEAGGYIPSAVIVAKLAKFYDVSVPYLLGIDAGAQAAA